MKVCCVYVPHNQNFDFKLTSAEKIQPALQAGKTAAFDFSHHGHALVTLYVHFLCSDWSKGEFMQKIYAAS